MYRSKTVFVTRLFTLLALVFVLSQGRAAGSSEPRSAGLKTWSTPYHQTHIEAAIWFPTTAPEARLEAGPFSHRVAADAKPEAGRHPLILISHGTGGMRLNGHAFATALARAGFIAVGITHPGDNFQDRSLVEDKRYFFERPRQVSQVLTALLADPFWRDLIDETRIGALGHSAGGYTVAALVGGTPDFDRIAGHCSAVGDDPSCAYKDASFGVMTPGGAPLSLPRSVSAQGEVADPRIRAGVMLAPLGVAIAPDSLGDCRVPLLLIGAEDDEVLARKYHFDHLQAQMCKSSPATRAWMEPAAGHFSFIGPIATEWRDRLGVIGADRPGFDRERFLTDLAARVSMWFAAALAR